MLASDWLVCLGKRVPIDDVKMKNPYTVLATIPVCLMAKSCLGKYLLLQIEPENSPIGRRLLESCYNFNSLMSMKYSNCAVLTDPFH